MLTYVGKYVCRFRRRLRVDAEKLNHRFQLGSVTTVSPQSLMLCPVPRLLHRPPASLQEKGFPRTIGSEGELYSASRRTEYRERERELKFCTIHRNSLIFL
jgi:hypothetical protein